ncbi:MAG: arylsulfatase, partial [Lacipirellulaceae bacterium]
HVEEAGKYQISLRRWPASIAHPIASSLPAGEPSPGLAAYRETKGKALEIGHAKLHLGDHFQQQNLGAGADEVRFEASLEAGPIDLTGVFILDDGTEVGAYYVDVERL